MEQTKSLDQIQIEHTAMQPLDSIVVPQPTAASDLPEVQASHEGEPTFDPLKENEELISSLKQELEEWTNYAKSMDMPHRDVLEHIGRLARLLTEAISNHAGITLKLSKSAESLSISPGAQEIEAWRFEASHEVYTAVSEKKVGEFIPTLRNALEAVARQRTLAAAQRKRRRRKK